MACKILSATSSLSILEAVSAWGTAENSEAGEQQHAAGGGNRLAAGAAV